MIHYHGLPITPETAALKAIHGGHAFVSFSEPSQLGLAATVCQSFALDNGAFSAWRKGKPITDWSKFYEWVQKTSRVPSCDFAVIPDVIDGSEEDNDVLLQEWPFPIWTGAPVWHLHESLERLERLVNSYPRVCFGSSGAFAVIGTPEWFARMHLAMGIVCDDAGFPTTKLHGLRMLNPAIFTLFPFASADSTNIGRNVGIDKKWKGTYLPSTKEARAKIMRDRIEHHNAPVSFIFTNKTGGQES